MNLLGSQVGPYRVVELLGRGGMGDVWAGVDERLQRRVALKAIRPERINEEAKARFLREARILSQLDDPRICKIYDYIEGKETDFLVLEFIRGKTLDEVLHDGLEWRQKLKIAEDLAGVLTEAHHQGVVHRDLKPGNLMIDDKGHLKILDFGLAFSLDEESVGALAETPEWSAARTPRIGRTQRGAILGTLAYMSPEQARGERATASCDLFSLGLILQQLFTEASPVPEGLPTHLALQRRSRGDTLPVEGVGRDLDRLITRLKSVTPEVRPTAREVGREIRRIRLAPRRRVFQGAAAVLLVLAVAGVAKYTVDLQRALGQAVEAKEEAELAQDDAIRARDEAEQFAAMLEDLFRMTDPGENPGPTITALDLLDRSALQVAVRFRDQPLVEARFLRAIGDLYVQVGHYDEALRSVERSLDLRERELEPSDDRIADSLLSLAEVLNRVGSNARARAVLERALGIKEQNYGAQSPALVPILLSLSWTCQRQGDYEAGLLLTERALGVQRSDQSVSLELEKADILRVRGDLLLELGRFREAEAVLRETLEIRRRHLGPRHPATGATLGSLGSIQMSVGSLAEAESLFREALGVLEDVLGLEHPGLTGSLLRLGNCYRKQRRWNEAETQFRRALKISENSFGFESPPVAKALDRLGLAALDQERFDEAAEYMSRAIQIMDRSANQNPRLMARFLNNRGVLEWRLSNYQQAYDLWSRAQTLGRIEPRYQLNQGLALWRLGRLDEAETRLRDALSLVADESELQGWCLWGLGGVLRDKGRYLESQRSYLRALEIRLRLRPAGHREIRETYEEYAKLLRLMGRAEEAEEIEARGR